MQFCIKLDPRDTIEPLTPSQKSTGIDVGLKFFLVDSQGHQIDCPNYYRKAEEQLNRLNKKNQRNTVRVKNNLVIITKLESDMLGNI